MTRKHRDRRIKKTNTALQQALFQLIVEKGFDGLSIQEICERANVGRSTFYAHFSSKSDLLLAGFDLWENHILEYLERELRSEGPAAQQPLFFSNMFLQHIRDHGKLYRALAGGHGGALVTTRLRQSLTRILNAEFRTRRASRSKDSYEVMIQFIVGGFLSMVAWWLDHSPRATPQELDHLFRKLATPVLEAEFGRKL